jgi:hypothetical protein
MRRQGNFSALKDNVDQIMGGTWMAWMLSPATRAWFW